MRQLSTFNCGIGSARPFVLAEYKFGFSSIRLGLPRVPAVTPIAFVGRGGLVGGEWSSFPRSPGFAWGHGRVQWLSGGGGGEEGQKRVPLALGLKNARSAAASSSPIFHRRRPLCRHAHPAPQSHTHTHTHTHTLRWDPSNSKRAHPPSHSS